MTAPVSAKRLSRAFKRAVQHVRGFSHKDALLRLRDEFGFAPEVIYDIGAHHGKWSAEVRGLFPHAQFFLFEANPANEEVLATASETYHIAALSEHDGQRRNFYTPKTGSNTGSSLYRAQSADFMEENLRVIPVETRRLDSLARAKSIPPPDLVKLDVQGSELDVLRGAGELLGTCTAMIAEVSLVQGNAGAPDAGVLLRGIEELGFRCVDLCKARRTVIGSVCEVDLLFVGADLYDRYRDVQLGKSRRRIASLN